MTLRLVEYALESTPTHRIPDSYLDDCLTHISQPTLIRWCVGGHYTLIAKLVRFRTDLDYESALLTCAEHGDESHTIISDILITNGIRRHRALFTAIRLNKQHFVSYLIRRHTYNWVECLMIAAQNGHYHMCLWFLRRHYDSPTIDQAIELSIEHGHNTTADRLVMVKSWMSWRKLYLTHDSPNN